MRKLNKITKILQFILKCSKRHSKHKFLVSISLVDFIRDNVPFFAKNEDKFAKYWERQSVHEAIIQANKYFEENAYMEVYELLNRMKYSKNIEIIWRIAKALYHLSQTEEIDKNVKKEMIIEAYDILKTSSDFGEGKANFHKWMAIVLHEKYGLESVENRVRHYPEVKNHLIKACELNPKDYTVQYILGKWCYEMANLTWFQRIIAKYLYMEPPTSSYQEAYRHLIKAEEMHPRSFLPCIYTLGNVCMKMGQYYRAKYYLHTVLSLPIHGCGYEKCCISSAEHLLEKLEKYDLGKDLLYDERSFGFDN